MKKGGWFKTCGGTFHTLRQKAVNNNLKYNKTMCLSFNYITKT